MRDLILHLRDEGRTVLFSSHILSDAELLCSRVAILAKGKLVAAGALSDLTAAQPGSAGDGWEIVALNVKTDVADRLTAAVRRVTCIAPGRYTFELAPEMRPEPLVADLAAAGASIVSLAPVRTTLEDVFMERISR